MWQRGRVEVMMVLGYGRVLQARGREKVHGCMLGWWSKGGQTLVIIKTGNGLLGLLG